MKFFDYLITEEPILFVILGVILMIILVATVSIMALYTPILLMGLVILGVSMWTYHVWKVFKDNK